MGPKVVSADEAARKAARAKLRLIPFTGAALEEEIERWKRNADADGVAFSKWIRQRLLEADARDEESATRFVHSPSRPPA